jgi:Vps53-like, N-terminal.
MSRIREKATESEAVVRNITKDIQVLDLAKKNLILSMTTLKRLQMLGVFLLVGQLCAGLYTTCWS